MQYQTLEDMIKHVYLVFFLFFFSKFLPPGFVDLPLPPSTTGDFQDLLLLCMPPPGEACADEALEHFTGRSWAKRGQSVRCLGDILGILQGVFFPHDDRIQAPSNTFFFFFLSLQLLLTPSNMFFGDTSSKTFLRVQTLQIVGVRDVFASGCLLVGGWGLEDMVWS